MLLEDVLEVDMFGHLEENWPINDQDLERVLCRFVAYHNVAQDGYFRFWVKDKGDLFHHACIQ